MSQSSGGGAPALVVTCSAAVASSFHSLGEVGEHLRSPLAQYLGVVHLEKHDVLNVGFPVDQIGNLIGATSTQRIPRYRGVAHRLIQLADDEALGQDEGINGPSVTRVASALMGLHHELSAAAPPTIVLGVGNPLRGITLIVLVRGWESVGIPTWNSG